MCSLFSGPPACRTLFSVHYPHRNPGIRAADTCGRTKSASSKTPHSPPLARPAQELLWYGWKSWLVESRASPPGRTLRLRSGQARETPRPSTRELSFTFQGATIPYREIEEVVMADRDGNSFLWFLAGLGVGSVVGVLYAPRSGDETRDVIRSKAQEGTQRARQQARRAREQAGDWMDRGRDVLNQQKEQFRSAYEAGRQAYNETTAAGAEPPKNI